MAVMLRANNECEAVQPANNNTFTLEELQSFVGGDVECVSTSKLEKS